MLLPPSETKRNGGDGPPLRLDELGSPVLNSLRAELIDELVQLAEDREASRRALSLSASQDAEIARNAVLRSAPTAPAISRYTGVLYDALDVESLHGAAASRANARLAIGSALFGLLRASDHVPAYRLSASSKLPGRGGLAKHWRPVLTPVLADLAARDLLVDLRSGAYAALAPIPGAVRVDVLTERPDGRRVSVSHFNKAHKGRLARTLATAVGDPGDAAAVAAIARQSGMQVEHNDLQVSLVVPA